MTPIAAETFPGIHGPHHHLSLRQRGAEGSGRLSNLVSSRLGATPSLKDSPLNVLLAMDGAETAGLVARTGSTLAAGTGARLTLLHVLEPLSHDSDIAAYWADFPEQRAYRALTRLQSWLSHEAGMANAVCHVTLGRPWEEVVRFAAANQTDLIVMARVGESRWFGQLTARTVERVVQHSSCPVLMVPKGEPAVAFQPKRLLLTTDLSPASLRAFPWAAHIARLYAARILLVNVQEPMGLPGTREYARFQNEIDPRRELADSRLESWRKAHLAPDLPVETRVMEGDPAPAVCRLARSAQTDLIIMSAHGAKGWWRKWLGGSTEHVLRNAPCSVLVVPHRPSAAADRRGFSPASVAKAGWDTPWTAWRHYRPEMGSARAE